MVSDSLGGISGYYISTSPFLWVAFLYYSITYFNKKTSGCYIKQSLVSSPVVAILRNQKSNQVSKQTRAESTVQPWRKGLERFQKPTPRSPNWTASLSFARRLRASSNHTSRCVPSSV